MFLISKNLFDTFHRPSGLLDIGEYEETNFVSHYYYFRIGAYMDSGTLRPLDEPLTLRPREFLRIWSLESFRLSSRVLGLFGSRSTLIARGLELIHSPSLDPGFNGSLELGLKNNLDEHIELLPYAQVGKVLFFDISDTTINIDDFLESSETKPQLDRRRDAERLIDPFTEGDDEPSGPNG